ncbi:2-C-methyl-D-erythritol 2,4-cyclodiphosphate synthase [Alicyclobacillus cycloheptanicus]|uniref:2-C-methyl-D-erythritol 2,4-cyclodiphosphate synthase n=1 Tax=Alicyclobacillus cycloheptanicus TaxID=1457 RepID=A0ABT9XKW9_9BACL|nr:2-C-methyl-D-erythritol 2,4-cyclodiphosphate synthase [Alicyclobacillus cycloheptanicus]MDQ0190381.1 2-C-methyl-D-erythritol 2,4-cyclodiphosphate synthase [Alicyclobacillus cycloheptanicus]WDM02624.1 2-C-methyl-D-erythritol 2,4-cyclodiphosphate synthase [Alicyclobacillus cycloheptanicus]
MRVGLGFDVHRFAAGRKLVLGGVAIDSDLGLEGHSDADVVLHALMDALLGALALGDIGMHFPNSDPAYRGADSKELTRRVVAMVQEAGYEVGNADVMVLAETPKIAPYVADMRASMAQLLGCETGQVSVKATTMERMGFVGRKEGVAAQAVVLLQPRKEDGK